jgi:hypothetical protein
MTGAEIRNLGFTPANSIHEAIERSLRTHGENASIGVIPCGGETIVNVLNA